MRPELDGLATVLTLIVIAALLLPKSDWGYIPARLSATARGERRYLFGPPSGRGALSSDFIERWFQLVRRELPRALELGIPLHLLAVAVEARGAERRRLGSEEWATSRAGLLFDHLAGRLTEPELSAQLREHGHPPPTAKLTWEAPNKLVMPPLEWRLEWDRHLEAMRSKSQAAPGRMPAQPARLEAVAAGTGLEIHTLGVIRILNNGEDFAGRLLRRPALAFAWLHLLAWATLKPGQGVARAVLGDEWFRGYDPTQQRKKVSHRLNEMNDSHLSGPLAGRLRLDGEYVSLDLNGCDYDVARLVELAEEAQATNDLLTAPFFDEVEKALASAQEEWLPGWEEVERRATDGRSGVGSVIGEVRSRVADAHLTLVETLGDSCLSGHQPARVIRHLEEAVRRHPDRTGLAGKLADAYEQSGNLRRAMDLREQHGLDAVS